MEQQPPVNPINREVEQAFQPADPGNAPKHSRKKLFFIVAFVFLVLISLVIIYKVVFGNKTADKNTNDTQTQTTQQLSQTSQVQPKDLEEVSTTKTYENGPMGLNLTYPSNWTAADTADNGIRVDSPEFTFKNLDNDNVKGIFRIYIRKGARAQDSKYIGRGVAISQSEKIVYTSPAVGQRTDTLLTNFGLDTQNNFAYFFVAGNFNLKEGDTLGPDYGKEPETYIISGGYTLKDTKEDMATNQVPVDFISDSSAYQQAIKIIKSLQLH